MGSGGLDRTVRLEEVVPGAWFPVEVVVERFNPKDGSVIFRQQTTLDRAQCRFNDKSALPDGIFEIAPRQELDELGQILDEIYQKQAATQTTDSAAKSQGPRATAQDFITTAMNGEYEKAARYIDPKHPMDDLAQFKELLTGQELNVIAVLADAEAALVITSAIRADAGRAGPLTFHLVRSSNSETKWLIEDIDVETPQGAKEQIERFLREHPAAAIAIEQGEDSARAIPLQQDPGTRNGPPHFKLHTSTITLQEITPSGVTTNGENLKIFGKKGVAATWRGVYTFNVMSRA